MTTDQLTELRQRLNQAETAYRAGQDWEAMALDQALALAQVQSLPEAEALAHEMTARFWLEMTNNESLTRS